MQSDSSPNMHIFPLSNKKKCLFVLIRCPLPRKKNLLLDRQLPQTLKKRIKGSSSLLPSLVGGLSAECVSSSTSPYFTVTLVFSPGAFESGKQNPYFNPNSICIAQMITSHLSKLPALLGCLTFSSNPPAPHAKGCLCNQWKQVLKPIGTADYCRLAGRAMSHPSPNIVDRSCIVASSPLRQRRYFHVRGVQMVQQFGCKQDILLLRNDVGIVKLLFQDTRQRREIIHVLRELQTGMIISHCLLSIHCAPAIRPRAKEFQSPTSWSLLPVCSTDNSVSKCGRKRDKHQSRKDMVLLYTDFVNQ